MLVQQEPDASSFPNGGIRNTFEARGYSAWDPTSPAFIVGGTLCIPTVFIAYTGEALDYKVPLLRSISAVNKAATEVCRYFDKEVNRVIQYLGWEQEYFLVDESLWAVRPDLMLTGRTLMGHESAKNQQLEDHYFGAIPTRVIAFMADLEYECLKLGIPVKTRHNEVAPNQFELAPVYEECNLANDHNQLLMTIMDKIARRHNFRVLLHEKPFKGINGSGKHNNWSLGTDTGVNLLSPGKTASENLQFITFLVNVISAGHKHNGLLKAAIMSATNSHRLGANEAPPAIISTFLGTQVSAVLDKLEASRSDSAIRFNAKNVFKMSGISHIPALLRDNTDRNRTSAFAFTGNRFELRAVGSSDNCAEAMIVLNTAVADEFTAFRERVDARIEAGVRKEKAIYEELKSMIRSSRAIRFDGNGYSDEWVAEAEKRGLPNFRSTVDCVPHYADAKNVALLQKFGVLSEKEIKARMEVLLENYAKTINIEALTMIDMTKKKYIPTCIAYTKELCDAAAVKQSLDICSCVEKELAEKVSSLTKAAYEATEKLEAAVAAAAAKDDCVLSMAKSYREDVIPVMDDLRAAVDALEVITPSEKWPVPAYSDIIFNV